MRLFLIRHAETVHNVGQAWAGTTDSALTNHGILQIQRLAQYFTSARVKFTRVFSSDLKRAETTAQGICADPSPQTQEQLGSPILTPLLIPYLREQHFGSLEGRKWRTVSGQQSYRGTETGPTTVAPVKPETEASMKARANSFLNEYLLPVLLDDPSNDETVAVVAHGIILRVLWNCISSLFNPQDIRLKPDVESRSSGSGTPFLPLWSNTGFMEMNIQRRLSPESLTISQFSTPSQEILNNSTFETAPTAPESLTLDAPLSNWTMDILSVDNKSHLVDLRRTRGGIGSATHDERQQKIDRFFK